MEPPIASGRPPSKATKNSWIAPSPYRSSSASARRISASHRGRSASSAGSSGDDATARLHAAAVQYSRGTSSAPTRAAAPAGSPDSAAANPSRPADRPRTPYPLARSRSLRERSIPARRASGSGASSASWRTKATAYWVNPLQSAVSSPLWSGEEARSDSIALRAKGTASRTSSGSSSLAKASPPEEAASAIREMTYGLGEQARREQAARIRRNGRG